MESLQVDWRQSEWIGKHIHHASSKVDYNSGENIYMLPNDMNRQSWRAMRAPPPHHNFVVIAPIIMKFGTDIKLDVFYTIVTQKFVTSLLLRNYDVITCILANV